MLSLVLVSLLTAIDVSAPMVNLSESFGGTYPRAVALANGEFLTAFDSFAPGQLVLRTSASSDNGATWFDRGTIAIASNDANRTLGNVFLAVLPTGRVLAAFRHHDQVGANYVHRLLVSYSDDNGYSWAFLSEIEVNTTVGIWEPFLFLAPDGSLQAYYAREKSGSTDQDIVMRRSFDSGATWGSLITVATSRGSREGMPSVAKLPDNSLMVVFESYRAKNTPKFVVRSMKSTNSGSTWSNRVTVYAPANTSKNAGAPYIMTLPSGQLLVSFMTDEDSQSQNWPAYATAKLMTTSSLVWVLPAVDGTPGGCYWPGLALNPLGEPFILFDQNGVRARKLVVN